MIDRGIINHVVLLQRQVESSNFLVMRVYYRCPPGQVRLAILRAPNTLMRRSMARGVVYKRQLLEEFRGTEGIQNGNVFW